MKKTLTAIATLMLGLCAWPASAEILRAKSYDMLNGETRLAAKSPSDPDLIPFALHDDSYSGRGATGTDRAPLTGGLGDLTDGFHATTNWRDLPDPFVGWQSRDPQIDFKFQGLVEISTIRLWVDDTQQHNGGQPFSLSVYAEMGRFNRTFIVDVGTTGSSFSILIEDVDMSGDSLKLHLPRIDGWMMLSEVEFEGKLVPEPGILLQLVGLACAGAFLARRRWKR